MNRAYFLVMILGISCSLAAMERDEERGSKASLDEDNTRSMQLSEVVQRSVKPSDLLLSVGLNKEKYNFSQLEALLSKMNISDYNAMVKKIKSDNDIKNPTHAQDVLFAIVKHQSGITAHQEKLYKDAISAVRFWQKITLAVGGSFALVMSVQAFFAALYS